LNRRAGSIWSTLWGDGLRTAARPALRGLDGDDTPAGGRGTLYGGGDDNFLFRTGDGRDTIKDFTPDSAEYINVNHGPRSAIFKAFSSMRPSAASMSGSLPATTL
jgi:hypothetical protein